MNHPWKKTRPLAWLLSVILFCTVLSPCTAETAAAEAPDGENAEWTVLFYMCGSDLETRYGFGSENLGDITECEYPGNILREVALASNLDYSQLAEKAKENGIRFADEVLPQTPVNVLVETGGALEWHAQELGMDIDTGSLQRWRYHLGNNPEGHAPGFALEETLPLASMAEPETLSDFIRWGVRTCPAKKYMLVLWGHGGGSKTGIFIDELFDGDVMYLDELGQALRDGGAEMEAVLFDACMMANIETAWQIHDSARWMIASEEVVPGRGTNIAGWLQELINNPKADGMQLGRSVCDMTQADYSDLNDPQAQRILTWSVIDLSKTERLVRDMEKFMRVFSEACLAYPVLASTYSAFIYEAEQYTLGDVGMRDIGSMLYNAKAVTAMDVNLRNDMVDALSEIVVYSLRGAGRSRSLGLSFCFAFQFDPEELNIFARNCSDPYYLATLDAISPDWNAPDWVYDRASRMPEIFTEEAFQPKAEKRRRDNGMPGLFVSNGNESTILDVRYRLYRLNELTGEAECLGNNVCRGIETEDGVLYSAIAPGYWWAVEGVPCCVNVITATDSQCIYNIPVRINGDLWYLRCLREYDRYLEGEVADENALSNNTIYGLWEGYEDQSDSIIRNIVPLSGMAGREFCLLYPLDIAGSEQTVYSASQNMTLYRALDVDERPLPPGTYYLEYEVKDALMRGTMLERVEMYWDGENWSYPEGFAWKGDAFR